MIKDRQQSTSSSSYNKKESNKLNAFLGEALKTYKKSKKAPSKKKCRKAEKAKAELQMFKSLNVSSDDGSDSSSKSDGACNSVSS